jgi:hypothetical protein
VIVLSSDSESEQEIQNEVKNKKRDEISKDEFLSIVNLTPRSLLTHSTNRQYEQFIIERSDKKEKSYLDKIYIRFLTLKLTKKFTFSLPFTTLAKKYSNQYFKGYFESKKSFSTSLKTTGYKTIKDYDKYCNRPILNNKNSNKKIKTDLGKCFKNV